MKVKKIWYVIVIYDYFINCVSNVWNLWNNYICLVFKRCKLDEMKKNRFLFIVK